MSDKNTNETILKTWSETQQKLLADWLDTLRKLGGTPTLELWRQTVDTWQNSVKETVDARAEYTRQLTETLAKAKGTPEEFRELAREGREQLQPKEGGQRWRPIHSVSLTKKRTARMAGQQTPPLIPSRKEPNQPLRGMRPSRRVLPNGRSRLHFRRNSAKLPLHKQL